MEPSLLYEAASRSAGQDSPLACYGAQTNTAGAYTRSPCFTPRLVYDLFALTSLANVHHFVIYALTFSF